MALSLKREATPCWRGDPGLLPRVADGGCAFKALRQHGAASRSVFQPRICPTVFGLNYLI